MKLVVRQHAKCLSIIFTARTQERLTRSSYHDVPPYLTLCNSVLQPHTHTHTWCQWKVNIFPKSIKWLTSGKDIQCVRCQAEWCSIILPSIRPKFLKITRAKTNTRVHVTVYRSIKSQNIGLQVKYSAKKCTYLLTKDAPCFGRPTPSRIM